MRPDRKVKYAFARFFEFLDWAPDSPLVFVYGFLLLLLMMPVLQFLGCDVKVITP